MECDPPKELGHQCVGPGASLQEIRRIVEVGAQKSIVAKPRYKLGLTGPSQ